MKLFTCMSQVMNFQVTFSNIILVYFTHDGFLPEWVKRFLFRLPFGENLNSYLTNKRFFTCTRLKILLKFTENLMLHFLQKWRFSPVYVQWWLFRLLFSENLLLHISQIWNFSSVYVHFTLCSRFYHVIFFNLSR